MRVKKMLAAGMAISMAASVILSGCSSKDGGADGTGGVQETGGGTAAGESQVKSEIEKPEKIAIMVDGSMTTKPNNRDAFE